jgi:hypothetical protein
MRETGRRSGGRVARGTILRGVSMLLKMLRFDRLGRMGFGLHCANNVNGAMASAGPVSGLGAAAGGTNGVGPCRAGVRVDEVRLSGNSNAELGRVCRLLSSSRPPHSPSLLIGTMAGPPSSFNPSQSFDFSFASSTLPPPPPLPPSAGLFSPSETTNLFGFLDTFNWELDADLFQSPGSAPPPHNPELSPLAHIGLSPTLPDHTNALPPPSFQSFLLPPVNAGFSPETTPAPPVATTSEAKTSSRSSSSRSPSARDSAAAAAAKQQKALLSSPQKRLNHIMSEQKRRNAIRDGYAQLTTLLAPKGAPPGSGMPTRGRPKGSGARAKGRTKGKSGVLFRAVDYIHWLDEGLDALREEVARVEQLAGIIPR